MSLSLFPLAVEVPCTLATPLVELQPATIASIVVASTCAAAALVLFAAALALVVASVRRKRQSNPDISWLIAFLQTAVMALLRVRYRLHVEGAENVPVNGGVLIAPNHISFVESVVISAICRRRLRFFIWAGYNNWFIRLVKRFFKLIPVSATRAKDAIRVASTHLAAGDCIAIFPEGQISRTGAMGAFQGGCALMSRKSGVPVVPVAVDGMWGSMFSFREGKAFQRKFPRLGRPALSVAFGAPVPPAEVDGLRDQIQVLAADLYARRPAFRQHLGAAIVRCLAAHPGKELVVDRGGERRLAANGALLLALARYVARHLRQLSGDEKRVGILLPPGIAATVTNVACLMLDKSPVNLNFTLGRTQLEACIETTGVKTFVTARALREKLDEKVPDFPWGAMERIVDIAALLNPAKLPKLRLALDIALVWILPGRVLRRLWGIPRCGGDREAIVLCTSGSSGTPKGVPLSHRNILGNCTQFIDTRLIGTNATLLGNLPVFHSFGITVTMWLALTHAIRVVNTTSPLETTRNITAIREERATILIGTPTFYRNYLKKAEPADMKSVRLVVAGAEKTPEGFAAEWETRFGGTYIEGYGATETTPVDCVNLLDVSDANVRGGIFYGNRRGSVGPLLCGIAARFANPVSGAPERDAGVLWVKGVNVFRGYLGRPDLTAEVLTPDGWYCTGDIARRDADGFIFIEGRQSRFSKLAGEMVPHGSVEDAIRSAIGLKFGDDAQQRIAVAARFDEAKGEALVLLSTVDIDLEELRAALTKNGIANLWIPRIIKRVDAIPVLATGKLDLQRMRELAASAS
jgi:acyl-[acyl-carrier-protein]-phospholipid O-acyltransferase/long-chain-fatty-acid--[acyl-carrier-protein] ligase